MVFKFIDLKGQTHLMDCTAITYVGRGPEGQQRAARFDGPTDVLSFDSPVGDREDKVPARYFVLERSDGRVVLSTHCLGAWLQNNHGGTIENLLALPDPEDARPAFLR